MRDLYIIGTTHNPADDVITVLQAMRPERLLLEMIDEEVQRGTVREQLPEMVNAYGWAKTTGVSVRGFDARIDILNPNVTEEDLQWVERRFQKYREKDFRELNDRIYDSVWAGIAKKVLDLDALGRRQRQMAENIGRERVSGTNLVLCGVGNLAELERLIPDARFPFRP